MMLCCFKWFLIINIITKGWIISKKTLQIYTTMMAQIRRHIPTFWLETSLAPLPLGYWLPTVFQAKTRKSD